MGASYICIPFLDSEHFTFRLGDYLGSGQFGTVYQGAWRLPTKEVKVAVKTLNANSHLDDKVRFLQEAAMMGQFNHVNVIKLYGVVIDEQPVSVADYSAPNDF